jgi:SSS family solute:Na+ symporter
MLGGMYSVVLTDVLQFGLIVVGVAIVTTFAVIGAGGISGMAAAVNREYGSAGFHLGEAPRYGLLFLLWTTWYYLSGWSSWQPVVQRTLSMQSVATSLRLFRITSVFMLMRASLPMLWGLAALAILGGTADAETALPRMLLQVIPAGLMGLVVVAFLAASMSTYDSYLLSFSAILVQDVSAPLVRRPLTDRQRLWLTRAGILVIGLIIYGWGVSYTFTDTVFRYIALTGSLSYAGIITGLVGGIYWPRATTPGAYLAFAASALPPIAALANPAIDPTHAGLVSFVLAPVGLVTGSLLSRSPVVG